MLCLDPANLAKRAFKREIKVELLGNTATSSLPGKYYYQQDYRPSVPYGIACWERSPALLAGIIPLRQPPPRRSRGEHNKGMKQRYWATEAMIFNLPGI